MNCPALSNLTYGGMVGVFGVVLDKDRELGEAQAEIKALRLSERAREKAVEEVNPQACF